MPRLQYPFVLVLFVHLLCFASAGQSLGSMSFPMDIGHHLTGALFRRAPPTLAQPQPQPDPQPQPTDASVIVTIENAYSSTYAPPPTLITFANFVFTNANNVDVEFQKSVRDTCNTVNVKDFECWTVGTASNMVNCNIVISLADGEHKAPYNCPERAVKNFMGDSTNLEFNYPGW